MAGLTKIPVYSGKRDPIHLLANPAKHFPPKNETM